MQSTRKNLKTKWLDLDYMEILHDEKIFNYAATGSSSVKRANSLFTKEPITLAWINTFRQGETLFDIGANVGMYTVYAAVQRACKVFSFEPESLNLAELNKNIFINKLHGQVLAYGVAISDVDKTDKLLLSDFGLGISYHDFEENSWVDDKEFAPDWKVGRLNRMEQGCIGRRIDSLIADGLPIPDHIKIDVDGLENRVVAGMAETIRNPAVKTILIEINFDRKENLDIIDVMTAAGWKFSWEQLRTHRKTKFTVEQIKRYQAEGKGGLNYIFYKDDWYEEFFGKLFDRYVPGDMSYLEPAGHFMATAR